MTMTKNEINERTTTFPKGDLFLKSTDRKFHFWKRYDESAVYVRLMRHKTLPVFKIGTAKDKGEFIATVKDYLTVKNKQVQS